MSVVIGISISIPFSSGGSSSWTIVADGLIVYRKRINDWMYVIEYSDDGGVTFEEIYSMEPDEDSIIISVDDGIADYRHLVRDGAYVIDHELTETGFSGAEDTDWEEIVSIKPI